MDYNVIRGDDSFHKWHEYRPLDSQYVKYAEEDPSLIAAGHKIADVYSAFANAKITLLSAGAKNFGDISSKDDFSTLYTKTHFLTYAVLEYAICLDISWQVIWAYIQPASLEYLVNNRYQDMEKECTSESVHSQLNCAIAQGVTSAQKLKDILIEFENDSDTKLLRTLYNAIKHQGMIHFEGLGANFSSMMMSVNGQKIPTLCRKSFTVESIEEMLYKYHFKFEDYIFTILKMKKALRSEK